jgi:hypothetical protein
MNRSVMQLLQLREKIARQNVFHFAGAIRKTVGLSYRTEANL